MKKTFRRALSLTIASGLTLAMAVTAGAAEGDTLTRGEMAKLLVEGAGLTGQVEQYQAQEQGFRDTVLPSPGSPGRQGGGAQGAGGQKDQISGKKEYGPFITEGEPGGSGHLKEVLEPLSHVLKGEQHPAKEHQKKSIGALEQGGELF